MITYVNAKYKGIQPPFTTGSRYNLQLTHFWMGNKVRIQAVGGFENKPQYGTERVYGNFTNFCLEWDIQHTWDELQQIGAIRRRREED